MQRAKKKRREIQRRGGIHSLAPQKSANARKCLILLVPQAGKKMRGQLSTKQLQLAGRLAVRIMHQPRHMHERNNNTDRRLTALTRSSPVGLFTSKNRRTWLWVSCCCCTSPSAASCCPCPRRRSAPAPSTRSSSRRLSELALPPAQSDAAGNQVKHITNSTSIINSRLRVIRLNWPREIK